MNIGKKCSCFELLSKPIISNSGQTELEFNFKDNCTGFIRIDRNEKVKRGSFSITHDDEICYLQITMDKEIPFIAKRVRMPVDSFYRDIKEHLDRLDFTS